MAQRIPHARYVELPGNDHIPWVGDQDAILDEIAEFLTGVRHQPDDRALATVFFSDIVGSTELARTLGDHGWKDFVQAVGAQASYPPRCTQRWRPGAPRADPSARSQTVAFA